ncbi:MAG TPA: ATP-binding protein [Terriglobales bacterium]|jgi:two-component system cell cycle sensor histidine kinase/response regulator CckA|nr:ATP-binding protein [Terriglobales bacterium]
MPDRSHRVELTRSLFLAAITVAVLMAGYEALKQLLFPHITIWQSHAATICFTTVLATLTAYFIGKRLIGLNQKLREDINKREWMSKALEQSEARYRSLFERNKAGVFRSVPGGGFIDCNDAFAQMFGYEREELLKLPPHVLYVGGKEERDSRIVEFRKTGQMKDFEICYRHKNGGLVWAIQNVALAKDEEGNDVTEGTVVDITERHRLEEMLRQSQKMEAVGRLAGGIAHDFNNLLTVIMGYGGSLRDRLKHDDEAREQAKRIAQAADKAAALTRQLLAFSRMQLLEARVINLNNLVVNLEKMLHRLIGEDIELITRTTLGLRRVKADPGQIEQVVMNLVVNARDAMPEGGTMTLETANVDLDENYAATHAGVIPGAYVMLAVSDTGTGMSAETQAQIFDPFFTTKEMGRGTGLGLSTVYGIVKQSEGHIWVYSEVGHGSTFKIYLPQTHEADEPASGEHPVVSTTRGSETVLLVEDDIQVRDLTRTILTACGYVVLAPADAQTALAMVEQHAMQIRLLLTDVIMPGINGRELARQLVGRNPEIKVLYMSGYTENTIGQHGVLEPGTYFLQKPFTPPALTNKVREILDNHGKANCGPF